MRNSYSHGSGSHRRDGRPGFSTRSTRRQFLGRSTLLGGSLAALGPQAVGAGGRYELRGARPLAQAEAGVLRMQYVNFPILDPHVVTTGMWFAAAALLEGLVVADEAGTAAVAGAAESWEVSADSTVYTFTLRP